MPKLFRKKPSYEMFIHMLSELKIQENRWFSKDELCLETLEIWLPELESYYLPCKAARFIHMWTPNTILTIMRHVLQCHDYILEKEERLYKGVKQYIYQIQSLRSFSDLSGANLQVDFL